MGALFHSVYIFNIRYLKFYKFYSYLSNKILLAHTDINDCMPDICQNNGTCKDLVNDYKCNCVLGFNGTNCENSKHYKYAHHFSVWEYKKVQN